MGSDPFYTLFEAALERNGVAVTIEALDPDNPLMRQCFLGERLRYCFHKY